MTSLPLRALALRTARTAANAAWCLRRGPPDPGASVPVLCYHRVLPNYAERGAPAYSVTPENFAAQMAFLRRAGFCSLTLDDYHALARGARPAPPRAVLVTFDDGFADLLATAWPIARSHDVTLNLFVSTGLIEGTEVNIYTDFTPRMASHAGEHPDLWRALTWGELGALRARGVGLGFHTHAHVAVTRLAPAALAADVARGTALFTRHLGFRPRAFAFPHGNAGSYDARTTSHLSDAGFDLQFTTRLGRTPLPTRGNTVDRLVIQYEDDLATFERKLLGGYDWLGGAREMITTARNRFAGRTAAVGDA